MASRKEILEMLSRGEIDIDRATELLAQAPSAPAPEAPPPPFPENPPAPEATVGPPPIPVPQPPAAPPRSKAPGKGRWLHIDVSELDSGRSRVRVNVPLGLMRFGMKIGARFTNEIDRDVMEDVLHALDGQELAGTLVEVEDIEDNERVHIYID